MPEPDQNPTPDVSAGQASEQIPAKEGSGHPKRLWFIRITSVLFIIFCVELGLFLLIYPWTDAWTDNYIGWAAPGAMQTPWHEFWSNAYIRGALSGLGLVNIWIAVAEVFRLLASKDIRND